MRPGFLNETERKQTIKNDRVVSKAHRNKLIKYGSIKKKTTIMDWNTYILRKKSMRLVQDGRVEGHELTPCWESTGIKTNCWTIMDRKTLKLTKKDTPHAKTKEKPQWDRRRGTITIQSNPITVGWVIHKLENTYTTEVHPLEWRLWAPRQASQTTSPAMGGGIPRESDLEG